MTTEVGMRRRTFLAAAGLGVAGMAGCARAEAAGTETVTMATYIPKSYDDLYPGIQTFMDTVTATSGGRLNCDMYDSGALLGAEQLLPGLLLGVADVVFQTSSYVSSSFPILGAMELPSTSSSRHRGCGCSAGCRARSSICGPSTGRY
jgi:TRAP-type C4-dicarboxylate transport system substrate-binding protein